MNKKIQIDKLKAIFKSVEVLPGSVFILENNKVKIFKNESFVERKADNPFDEAKRFLENEKGAKVGFLSFNLAPFSFDAKWEIYSDNSPSPFPDIFLVAGKIKKFDDIWKDKTNKTKKENKFSPPEAELILFETEGESIFKERVKKIKEEIRKGNVYQVNIARKTRWIFKIKQDDKFDFCKSILKRYIQVQPVPYPAFFYFPESWCLISGSPELFLKKEGNKIVSRPMKGTRKVQEGKEIELAKELRESEKDRAENLMIVDMVRNDLSRFCSNVKATQLFEVQRYSTVLQMISEIEGEIQTENISEILKSTFPPASVTGAPKSYAMHLIGKLEGWKRGPYCGAIGIFFENGDFELSVAIRIAGIHFSDCENIVTSNSIFKYCKATVEYWSGCGIVWDSDPEAEWQESLAKENAFRKTLKELFGVEF